MANCMLRCSTDKTGDDARPAQRPVNPALTRQKMRAQVIDFALLNVEVKL
jgi:hypothetical protein